MHALTEARVSSDVRKWVVLPLAMIAAMAMMGASSPSKGEAGEFLLEEDPLRQAVEAGSDAPPLPSGEGGESRGASLTIHDAVMREDPFPSAAVCGQCHQRHYREWSVSPHAYAQLSPVFNAMNGRLQQLTHGTLGDFCIRCHSPVGMAKGEPVFTANTNRHPVSLEGVTCIACHRVEQPYRKESGRRALAAGGLRAPIKGPRGGAELARVLENPDVYGVVTAADRPGRQVHGKVQRFFQLTSSAFCSSCHDVNLPGGFRLEEASSVHAVSPAAKKGLSCQDCHMGLVPGIPSRRPTGPAARLGKEVTRPRMLSNHMFAGPDHSIVHPGLFPHNPDVAELATPEEWASFDHEEGWGTPEFEAHVPAGTHFPPRWSYAEDRIEARELLDRQEVLLAEYEQQRLQVLRAGYGLGAVRVHRWKDGGLRVEVDVVNRTEGHTVPTGFIADRLVYLRVTLRDAEGEVVYRSGDLDPDGDLRDEHSAHVAAGLVPLDEALFSLQSHFKTRDLRGSERRQVLNVNLSTDVMPYVRPATRASTMRGRPRGSRIHRNVIPPGGARTARYEIGEATLLGRVPAHLSVELVAGMVPVNLIREIQGVGFENGLSAREVARRVVEGHRVLWKKTLRIAALARGEARSEEFAGGGGRGALGTGALRERSTLGE